MSSAYGRPRGMLTLETLGALVGRERHRDRHRRLLRSLRPARGQALRCRAVRRRHGRPRHARLQLPADDRHGDAAGARVHVRELGAWLRRFPSRARSRHAARRELARQDGARVVRSSKTTEPIESIGRAALDAAASGGLGARARASRSRPRPSSSTTSFARATVRPRPRAISDLEPAGWYLEDYHILQGTRTEFFTSAVRHHLKHSGVPVESSKGEWGLGQHELNVRYADVLEMADRHVSTSSASRKSPIGWTSASPSWPSSRPIARARAVTCT